MTTTPRSLASRKKPLRTFPTYYARAYAAAPISLDQLGAHLGHRVDSLDEYIDDQAKAVLNEQAHYSRKIDRSEIEEDAIEQITDFWTDQLAANFKIEIFASAAEREDLFDIGSGYENHQIEVVIDFAATSNRFYPNNAPPSPESDTPETALAQLTKGNRRRTSLYDRIHEYGLLDPMFSNGIITSESRATLYLEGNTLAELLGFGIANRRIPRARSKSREL